MDESSSSRRARTNPRASRRRRRPRLAAWIGSVLEYYDFFIYGTAAALVFPSIFFPQGNPTVATIASLATFGVGYVARPVGAFFMGHIGDKFGRKRVLVATLILMGVSTFAIGLLPTYAQVGALAPALLVLLRLLQGLSASGEQAGANSMTLEHAPPGRRGYYSSFTLSGTQAGSIVANAVFLPLAAVLSQEQLLSWGWRIPFFLSVVVVVVGFVIRRTLDETPAFKEEVAHDEVARLPRGDLVPRPLGQCAPGDLRRTGVGRQHDLRGLRLVVRDQDRGHQLDHDAVGRDQRQRGRPVRHPALGDLVGPDRAQAGLHRRRAGQRGLDLRLFVAHLGAEHRARLPVGVLMSGVVYSAANGVWPSFYGEMFTTKVRLSGMAIGTQIGFAIGGFSPSIAAAIEGEGSTGWVPVAVLVAVACMLSAISAATARDNYKVP